MYKAKREATIWLIVIFLLSMGIANAQTDAELLEDALDKYGQDVGMDYGGVNPGFDKQCLKYEDCPEWDGNPDTKIYYDLMKLPNGSGVIAKSDFNWNVHLYLCHQNKLLDSINGEGSFEKRAIQSAKDGWIPCPINANPNWTYDWESHILKAQSKQVKLLGPRSPMGRQGLMNSTIEVE